MKLTTLLLFLSSFCFGQELMFVEVKRVWNHRLDIDATPGTTYIYTLGPDTVRYFHPPAGKTVRAKMIFEEVTDKPAEPVVETVDANRETVQFSGAWTAGQTTAAGWLNNTIAYSNTVGETAKYTFTGTGIEVYAETKNSHGTGNITITKGTQVIASTNVSFVSQNVVLPAKIFEKKDLPRGEYTITLKVVSGYVLLDYLKVTK